jgi:hypothetical protein
MKVKIKEVVKMKIKIRSTVEKTVEVELPIYYVHDLSDQYTTVIYGKIEEGRTITVTERRGFGKTVFEVEVEENNGHYGGYSNYITDKANHGSNADEFERALEQAKEFIGSL